MTPRVLPTAAQARWLRWLTLPYEEQVRTPYRYGGGFHETVRACEARGWSASVTFAPYRQRYALTDDGASALARFDAARSGKSTGTNTPRSAP